MTLNVRLEAAQPDDAAAMLEVHRAAVHQTTATCYAAATLDRWAPNPVSADRIASFAHRLATGEEDAVLARSPDGHVVGFGSLIPAQQELRAVYVAPSHGQLGVGGLLLAKLEALARGRGLAELRMNASLNAVASYRSHGFEAHGSGEHTLGSGARLACVHMRKPLPPA